MVLYEVKLICSRTKEVIFHSLEKTPVLPPEKLYERVPRPFLVITTKEKPKETDKKVA
jgi:hypothetical protein